MAINDLEGRTIDDVPYSGLIERLAEINIICHTAGAAKEELTKADLLSFLNQISVAAAEAMAFSGATREEVSEVTNYLLKGMSISEEGLQ